MTDIVVHYGVQGMKWGVRRQTMRTANANANRYYQSLASPLARQFVLTPISEKEYSTLPSKPIKLGREFDRVSREGTSKLRDIAFVSKTEDDRNRYNTLIGAYGGKKSLQLKLESAKEAVSPSLKVRIDTYIETLGQEIPSKNAKQTIKGRDLVEGLNHRAAKALNNREVGLLTYKSWAQGQHANTPLYSAYFNKLRAKGYTAVIDDADRGIVSDLPIILFPKESGTRVTEIKPLTKDDVIEAKLAVKTVIY